MYRNATARFELAARKCDVGGRVFSFTVYAWFEKLPSCHECGKELAEGKLGFWCDEKRWISCPECETEARIWLERHSMRHMEKDGIRIGRPVWVNLERGAKFEGVDGNEGN